MTRTRRFLQGVAFGYANQALVTVVGLWFTAFLLHRLGQADYGLWLLATQVLGYVALLDLGVVALLPREVASATGRAGGSAADASDLAVIVGRTGRLVIWQLPLVALVAAAIWLLLPAEWAPLHRPLGLVLLVFVVGFPLRILQALLNGLQELAYLGATGTAMWLTQTAVTAALVLAGWGMWSLAAGWTVGQMVAWTLWARRVSSHYRFALPRGLPAFPRAELRERASRSLWISLQQVAQVLRSGTDLLIIGKIMGPEAVVPYFCTAKVLQVLGNQPQALAQTAQPALSELRASASRDHLGRVVGALTTAILVLSGGVVCIVLVVNEGFVSWWVGAERYGGFALTAALAAGMLLRHWNTTAVYTLFAFGHDRRISLTTLLDGAVTVGATVWLVGAFGLLGAAIGVASGVVLIGLPWNLRGVARDLGVRVTHLFAQLWPWAWRFALPAAAAAAASRIWVTDTLPALIAGTLAAGAVYAALGLPLLLREPLGTYVRPRLEALRRFMPRPDARASVDV